MRGKKDYLDPEVFNYLVNEDDQKLYRALLNNNLLNRLYDVGSGQVDETTEVQQQLDEKRATNFDLMEAINDIDQTLAYEKRAPYGFMGMRGKRAPVGFMGKCASASACFWNFWCMCLQQRLIFQNNSTINTICSSTMHVWAFDKCQAINFLLSESLEQHIYTSHKTFYLDFYERFFCALSMLFSLIFNSNPRVFFSSSFILRDRAKMSPHSFSPTFPVSLTLVSVSSSLTLFFSLRLDFSLYLSFSFHYS